MPRDVEAFEVLGEVLDHVVALGLAVHQHVEAELFLQLDDALDLVLHELARTAPSVSSPLSARARAVRISPVCGKEPMVVVGSGGRCRASVWAASRTP